MRLDVIGNAPTMFATKTIIIHMVLVCLHYQSNSSNLVQAEPLLLAKNAHDNNAELIMCEEQLSKYRKFVLQAVISFEDVCDAYNARPTLNNGLDTAGIGNTAYGRDLDAGSTGPIAFFNFYQPPQHRSEIWAFFKLLMAQFNDVDFANVVRDTVIQRCRIKSQQRDEKRNTVVLGKKQRFHSWGGKRAPMEPAAIGNEDRDNEGNNFFI